MTTSTSKGLDSATDLSPKAKELVDLGYTWVARYLFEPGTSSFKDALSADEARVLTDAGLFVVSIWESGRPTSASYFTIGKGTKDATHAAAQAKTVGQPHGTPIYFAVDYDAAPADIVGYFKEINSALRGTGYLVGCYGPGRVLQYLHSRGLLTHEWLPQSCGWAGYLAELSIASIVQGKETVVLGRDVDFDVSNGIGGGWKLVSK